MLPQALIVTGQKGEDLRSYIHQLKNDNDEVLYVEHHLNTSKTSTGIYVEDIRELQLSVRGVRAKGRTIVVVDDAAKMTAQSQNALLKLLEEPRERLHIALCTYDPMQLLPTVRSRCQVVQVAATTALDIPEDTKDRIAFMSGGISAEASRLATNEKYFEERSKVFANAKKFVGGTPYERLCVIKQATHTREAALELIDACLTIYRTLLTARYSSKLQAEADALLRTEEALRTNGNVKLQLLHFVVQ